MDETELTRLSQLSAPWVLTAGGPDHLLYKPSDGDFILLLQNPYGTGMTATVAVFTGHDIKGDGDARGVQFSIALDPGVIGMLTAAVAAPSGYKVLVGASEKAAGKRLLPAGESEVVGAENTTADTFSLPLVGVSLVGAGGESVSTKTWELQGGNYPLSSNRASASLITVYRPRDTDAATATMVGPEAGTTKRFSVKERLVSWAAWAIAIGAFVTFAIRAPGSSLQSSLALMLLMTLVFGSTIGVLGALYPAPAIRLIRRRTHADPPLIIGGPVEGIVDRSDSD